MDACVNYRLSWPYPANGYHRSGTRVYCGQNCDAAIETKRGPTWGGLSGPGELEADTGPPEPGVPVPERTGAARPQGGLARGVARIGDRLQAGQVVAPVDGQPVRAANLLGCYAAW